MSNLTSPQPPQHFLELVRRLYEKRDEILESTNKLVEYSYQLDECDDIKLKRLLSKMHKEMNRIISDINDLSPHLKNPELAECISIQVRQLGTEMEGTALRPYLKGRLAMRIRDSICQDANKTTLRPTPKSIKQAFGVSVGLRDIKVLLQHQQDNW
jgi:hypothetical protein